jgi:hypothetical protein
VTVAKYRTPRGLDIDHRGIVPDASCAAPPPLRRAAPSLAAAAAGRDAGAFLPGVPYESASSAALRLQLAGDRCVLKAERLLQEQQQRGGPAWPQLQVASRRV